MGYFSEELILIHECNDLEERTERLAELKRPLTQDEKDHLSAEQWAAEAGNQLPRRVERTATVRLGTNDELIDLYETLVMAMSALTYTGAPTKADKLEALKHSVWLMAHPDEAKYEPAPFPIITEKEAR